jgi:tetrahydromethanopterin S-methyltransferase subunit G
VSEPVSIETRVSRNTNDIEALYGLVQEFAGRTRASFAKVNQRFDDLEGRLVGLEGKVDGLEGRFDGLEGKVDGLAVQLGEVLGLLRKQS